MKAYVIGDLHFGAGFGYGKPHPTTGINSRLLDYEKTLSDIITRAIDEKIEIVVFLGDIFETRNPLPHHIVPFYRQLTRLSTAGIRVYIIAGNHDETKNRIITSSLDPLKELNIPNVFIYTEIDLVQFTDSYNETINIVLVPYRNRQSYDKENNEEAIVAMTNEIQQARGKAKENYPILACSHMMMENTIPADIGEYGLNELILPFESFAGIDVVINGHIHKSSILNEEPLFIYSGSMECRDFSERNHKKCFLIYDTNKVRKEPITFVPIITRSFIDFDFDFSVEFPEDPMMNVINEINEYGIKLKDAVVRMNIKLPETKLSSIDVLAIRKKFNEFEVSCISDVNVSPVVLKQLRNQKINDAVDDISAFKHYVSSQINVVDDVLSMGLDIIESGKN